jgi:hypothetical protein
MEELQGSLCTRCSPIFEASYQVGQSANVLSADWKWVSRPKIEGDLLVHYSSFHEFERSAAEGCHLCLLFSNQIPPDKRALLRDYSLEGRIGIWKTISETVSLYDIKLHYSFPPKARCEQGSTGFMMILHMNLSSRESPGNPSDPCSRAYSIAFANPTDSLFRDGHWVELVNRRHMDQRMLGES